MKVRKGNGEIEKSFNFSDGFSVHVCIPPLAGAYFKFRGTP